MTNMCEKDSDVDQLLDGFSSRDSVYQSYWCFR